MDNKAYLDQIAVKGKKTVNHEPLLTPVMIKILIAGLITLITIVIVAVMINNTNAKLTQSYERLYLRVTQFCGKKGPYETYSKYISSSQLRSYASQLETSITNTNNSLSGIWSSLNVSKDKLTKDVKTEENTAFNSYMSRLQEASISGQMDAYYSSQTANQIMKLKTLERQIIKKTTNKSLTPVLEQSVRDLDELYELFQGFNDSL
jgi:hypothetical protein